MGEPVIKCRCGAEIRFVKLRSGKSMPIDPQAYNMLVVSPDGLADVRQCYVSHFASCPMAEDFRQRVKRPDHEE